jgi:hypothetical protein
VEHRSKFVINPTILEIEFKSYRPDYVVEQPGACPIPVSAPNNNCRQQPPHFSLAVWALDGGFDDHLAKPVNAGMLDRLLASLSLDVAATKYSLPIAFAGLTLVARKFADR